MNTSSGSPGIKNEKLEKKKIHFHILSPGLLASYSGMLCYNTSLK